MKLLGIDSSARRNSVSRQLTGRFVEACTTNWEGHGFCCCTTGLGRAWLQPCRMSSPHTHGFSR